MAAERPTAVPGSARWWMERSGPVRPVRRDAQLTPARIVAACLAIVDQEGHEALTMRHLADRLGVAVSALYGHVTGREEMLVLAADEMLAVLDAEPPPGDGWRGRLEWLVGRLLGELREHPSRMALLRAVQAYGPNSMAARERALALFLADGFSATEAQDAYVLITTYVVGAAQRPPTPGQPPTDVAARRAAFEALDRERFPLLTAHAAELSTTRAEEFFSRGLSVLLDGIEARHARAGAERGTRTSG